MVCVDAAIFWGKQCGEVTHDDIASILKILFAVPAIHWWQAESFAKPDGDGDSAQVAERNREVFRICHGDRQNRHVGAGGEKCGTRFGFNQGLGRTAPAFG